MSPFQAMQAMLPILPCNIWRAQIGELQGKKNKDKEKCKLCVCVAYTLFDYVAELTINTIQTTNSHSSSTNVCIEFELDVCKLNIIHMRQKMSI